jgi:hypothetical protein
MRALQQCSAPHTLQSPHHNGVNWIQKAPVSRQSHRNTPDILSVKAAVGSAKLAGFRLVCAATAAAPSGGGTALPRQSVSYGDVPKKLAGVQHVCSGYSHLYSSRKGVVCGSGAAAAGEAGGMQGRPGIGDKVIQWLSTLLQVPAMSS